MEALMLRRLTAAVLIFALLTCGFPAVRVFGATTTVNISGGYIQGESVDYYFNIPWKWHGTVIVERQSSPDSGAVEALLFYCGSISGRSKPALMFTLHVFNKASWTNRARFEKVKESGDLIAAIVREQPAYFEFRNDQFAYEEVFEYIDTAEKIGELVFLNTIQPERRIYINNVAIHAQAVVENDVYYIPLRAVAEALGYTVTWDEDNSIVEIFRSPLLTSSVDRFKITSQTKKHEKFPQQIQVRLINDRTYVMTAYIKWVLGFAFDVSGVNDVNIITK